ncbi:ETS homologous factor-like [Penaeus chinensis]|uniref:ETS homologous factor-like n=1 Tax=Penaeus chinensis TaxID=139456 RepID=UPI001FB82FB7|nr:ETS homologous factor-like [Penaeus chinensis]
MITLFNYVKGLKLDKDDYPYRILAITTEAQVLSLSISYAVSQPLPGSCSIIPHHLQTSQSMGTLSPHLRQQVGGVPLLGKERLVSWSVIVPADDKGDDEENFDTPDHVESPFSPTPGKPQETRICPKKRSQTTMQYPDMWDTPLLLHHEPSSRQTSYSYGEMNRNTASVSEWDGKDCVAWASSVCRRQGLDQNVVDVISFGTLSGRLLLQFSPQDFSIRLGNDVGRVFYEDFQDVVHQRYLRESDSHDSGDEGALVVDLSQQRYTYEDLDSLSQPIDLSKRCSSADVNGGRDDGGDAHHPGACCKAYSEVASSGSMDEDGQPDAYLNRISTNRRRHRGPKSWEFLMRLLADERTNPSVIKWEDQSAATFRLIQPHYIAKLWGKRSGRPELTYNNFARALRYHYKKGQLVKVSERQLVYGCGPDALLFVNQLLNHERPAEETRGFGDASCSGLKR